MLDFFFRYRINVMCLAFIMCIAIFSSNPTLDNMMVATSFGMVMSYVYLLNKAADLKEDSLNPKSLPINSKNIPTIRNIAIALAVIPVPYLLFKHPKILIFYILVPGLFGFLYSYPLKFLGFNRRLKDLLFTKNLVSAFTWGSIPAILPLLYYNGDFTYDVFYRLIFIAMSVLVIEIMWDIRDIDGDLAAGIKTIPNQFGVNAAKIICLTLFGITTFPNLWKHLHMAHGLNLVYIAENLLTLGLLLMIKKTSHAYTFQAIILIWFFGALIPLIQRLTS